MAPSYRPQAGDRLSSHLFHVPNFFSTWRRARLFSKRTEAPFRGVTVTEVRSFLNWEKTLALM
jgi:hypothetical protein